VDLITVEVMLKPYRDKRPSMEMFDLTEEIVGYRERTAQQVEWLTREMAQYEVEHGNKSPWPMSESACFTKYGTCEYLPLCNTGLNDKTAKLYRIKVKQ